MMDKIFLEKLKTLTVLYAEDEKGIRKKISDSLRYYVKEVIEAENGEIALKLYKEYRPDILFTDIMMPKLDGIALVRSIRKGDTKTPIVMITAHTDKEYLLRAVDLHLEQYIIKPINLTDLKHALHKCLDAISDNHAFIVDLAGHYSYDFDNKVLTCADKVIKLSKKEMAFLELLLQNRHRVVTYSELQNYIWQDEIMSDYALKSLVRNIRYKFPKDYIKNLSGVGYKLNDHIS